VAATITASSSGVAQILGVQRAMALPAAM